MIFSATIIIITYNINHFHFLLCHKHLGRQPHEESPCYFLSIFYASTLLIVLDPVLSLNELRGLKLPEHLS